MHSTTINVFRIFTTLALAMLMSHSLADDHVEFGSVDEAVAKIRSDLESKNFEISLVVNHSAAAASVGLELRPTQVIFARQPKRLEFLTLRRSPTVGIDLPIKFLVYEDENGDVQVRNNGAGYLIDRHDARFADYIWKSYSRISNKYSAPESGLVSIASSRSIEDTVTALSDAISANPNFRIPLVLDYCEGSRRSCPQLIVFGNPNAGTPLMQATQEAAIDLPQKFLVSKDKKGKVMITYNDPVFVGKRHNIQGQDGRLQAISSALANFASQGAGMP